MSLRGDEQQQDAKAIEKGNSSPINNMHNPKGKEADSDSEYPMEWSTKNPTS